MLVQKYSLSQKNTYVYFCLFYSMFYFNEDKCYGIFFYLEFSSCQDSRRIFNFNKDSLGKGEKLSGHCQQFTKKARKNGSK